MNKFIIFFCFLYPLVWTFLFEVLFLFDPQQSDREREREFCFVSEASNV